SAPPWLNFPFGQHYRRSDRTADESPSLLAARLRGREPVRTGPGRAADAGRSGGQRATVLRPAGAAGRPHRPGGGRPVWARDKVITARMLKVEKHPNADKLKLVT